MRQDHQMRMPVVLEVGVTHLRITSVGTILSTLLFSLTTGVGQSAIYFNVPVLQINRDYLID